MVNVFWYFVFRLDSYCWIFDPRSDLLVMEFLRGRSAAQRGVVNFIEKRADSAHQQLEICHLSIVQLLYI